MLIIRLPDLLINAAWPPVLWPPDPGLAWQWGYNTAYWRLTYCGVCMLLATWHPQPSGPILYTAPQYRSSDIWLILAWQYRPGHLITWHAVTWFTQLPGHLPDSPVRSGTWLPDFRPPGHLIHSTQHTTPQHTAYSVTYSTQHTIIQLYGSNIQYTAYSI
jgi:hypothetical protein